LLLRTFIALETPISHRDALAEYLLRWKRIYSRGINWVNPQNLHQTLLFLGDTSSSLLPEIKQILQEAVLETHPFELTLKGFELFPATQPRLLWAKLEAAERRIFVLAKTLYQAISEIGLQPDQKPLKLHITMGRIKAAQTALAEQEFLSSPLPVTSALYDTITLYQSILRPEGAVYKPIESIKL
jgi:2'-5' RNA ligase